MVKIEAEVQMQVHLVQQRFVLNMVETGVPRGVGRAVAVVLVARKVVAPLLCTLAKKK